LTAGADLPEGTVTFLFTDIEGSTRLVQELRGAYADLRAAHRRLLRAAFERHGGREIDTQGDSFFVAFTRANDAIAAAGSAQQALAAHKWPEGHELRVRMGLHTGEPIVGDEGYVGVDVHRAARICAAGHGGQVLLSGVTRDLVEDDLLAGVGLLDLGIHQLKDLERAERIHQLVYPGMPAAFPPLRTSTAATPATEPRVAYRLLGSMEVVGAERPLPLGGAKQRALLALLLLNANRVVSRERLIDELWDDDPPETAVTSVQVYVSRLRKLLPADTVVTRPPGYLLRVEPEAIDLVRFERLVAEAHGAEPERASRLLRDALALWRGPPLGEFDEAFARIEGGRLEDLRLAALEERIEADLALDRRAGLIGELEALIAEHPQRERLRGQLMLALYRSGRQAEALEAYRDARAALDELGIEPGERVRELERAILTQDAALTPPPPLVRDAVELPGPLRAISPFPFVGREKELAALRSALALAEQGEGGQVALVSGEAGSGKTRLARELAREAGKRGTLVLYGSAHPDVNMPYQPFVEALEFLVRISDPVALDDCIGDRRGDLARIVPDLTEASAPMADEPQTARHRLHVAVAELLIRVGAQRPVLLVVEDIHWADTPSVDLLRHLTRATPEARVCLVTTCRDRSEASQPELMTALSDLARLEGITRIDLAGLRTEDIAEFVARSSGTAVVGELPEAIDALTDGTPFLVCELWRALRESGSVEVSRDGVRMTRAVTELDSPESVRDIVSYRLSRLAPQTTAMLEIAAVAGTEFELGLLGDEGDVVSAAEEAVESGMIEAVASTGTAYRFTHELVRRALYDRLSSVRRARLHLSVGEALERRYSGNLDRVAADLAHHFTLGVSVAGTERAVEHNARAARVATAAFAFGEAVALLTTALKFVDDDRTFAELSAKLGYALRFTGKTRRAEVVLRRGIDAARAAGDPHLAALASVELAQLKLGSSIEGDRSIERDMNDSIEVFTQLGDNVGLAKAWHVLGTLEWARCRLTAAEERYLRALSHAERAGDRRQRTLELLVLAGAALHGPMPVAAGIERCESILADPTADRLAEPMAAAMLGVLTAMIGKFVYARSLAGRSISVCTELGLASRVAEMREYAARVELLANRPDAAEQELRLACATMQDLGAQAVLAALNATLAEVLCELGRFDEAESLAKQAREEVGSRDVVAQISWRRASAKVASARRDATAAEELLRDATVIASQTDALNLQADLSVDLAGVMAQQSDSRAARIELEHALALYRRKGNIVSAARTETAIEAMHKVLNASQP
jgi:DNA-binding SARP family transcriptional activator/class 3 adenylate cyclase